MCNSKIRLQEVDGRGTGVLAAVHIARGEEVLTFSGRSAACRGAHTLQVDADSHLEVDAPGRFVNNSFDPNCGIRERRSLVALRDIAAGEEITFDYAMTEAEMEPMSCLCGSQKCRGTIAGVDRLRSYLDTLTQEELDLPVGEFASIFQAKLSTEIGRREIPEAVRPLVLRRLNKVVTFLLAEELVVP